MNKIILSIANIDYLNIARAWLASMRLHGGGCLIRLDFINGNETINTGLKKIYPNLEIVNYNIPKTGNAEQDFLNILYARPKQMQKALNEDWDQICSMDCDILARKPINGIWEQVESDTMKIRIRKDSPVCRRFQGGVYLFGNSINIRKYHDDVIKELGNDFAKYDGQRILYTTYIKYQNSIRLVGLEKKYNDFKFHDNSVIWHAKHGNITNPKYVKCLNAYIIEANKWSDKE